MPGAGDLRERIAFDARAEAPDGYGNVQTDWVEQFTVAAKVRPLRGGEDVMAGRLAGRQPMVITVRQSSDTRQITAEWRARDARAGTIYAISGTPTDPDGRRAWLEILATGGPAP